MARAAHAAGVTIFGWSDHAPLFADADDHPKPGIQMARSQWDGYLAEAEQLRARLGPELPGLDLRIGVEADYLPGTETSYRSALDRSELDYVLGSVHEVGPWHIFKPATLTSLEDIDGFHRGYWRALRDAAQSGLFDVLSHLDAIKAMVPAAEGDMAWRSRPRSIASPTPAWRWRSTGPGSARPTSCSLRPPSSRRWCAGTFPSRSDPTPTDRRRSGAASMRPACSWHDWGALA